MTPKEFKEFLDEINENMPGVACEEMINVANRAGDEGKQFVENLRVLNDGLAQMIGSLIVRDSEYFASQEFNEELKQFNTARRDVLSYLRNNPDVFTNSDNDKLDKAKAKEVTEMLLKLLPNFRENYRSVKDSLASGTDEWPEPVEQKIVLEERKSSGHMNPELAEVQGADPTYRTQGQFGDIATKLEKAKTWYNSGEYNDLVEAVKSLNKVSKIDQDANLDDVHKYAIKLWAVKKQINKYLDHKGKDGVKQNAFDKLAAVEELNQEISKRLSTLDVNSFTYGKYTVDVNAFASTYKDEMESSRAEYLKKHAWAAPSQMNENECNQKYAEAKKVYPKLDQKDYMNADTCMCRIILRAEKKVNNDLVRMRKQFQAHPAREVAKAPVAPQMS